MFIYLLLYLQDWHRIPLADLERKLGFSITRVRNVSSSLKLSGIFAAAINKLPVMLSPIS